MGGATAPSLFFVRGAAPPPAIRWPMLLPYLRAVRAARPGRMARPAVPARGYRPSACPLRRPYGRPRDQKGMRRHCNRPTGPRPSGRHQGAGPAGHCGPPAVRVEAVLPWRRGGFWGLPAAPGVAASPGPSPARPRFWSILGGAPQSPAARVGPAVRNGCVPWRRQAPVFSVAPGPQRGAGT